MPAMNVGMQRRIGKLPKSPEFVTYKGHTYGNTHRGYGMRRPTPTSSGFFGLGSTANGDGKLHYYGNGPGQADLPMHGFYGIGSAELDYQAANMLIDGASTHQPTHMENPGLYGGTNEMNDMLMGMGVGVLGLAIGSSAKSSGQATLGAALAIWGGYTAFKNRV